MAAFFTLLWNQTPRFVYCWELSTGEARRSWWKRFAPPIVTSIPSSFLLYLSLGGSSVA